jgi:mRNA-degrading endonuclease toxin of MazEF toxin-antitoxin module
VPVEPSPVNGLSDLSYVKCEQIMTISKDRLQNLLGRVDDEVLTEIEKALRLHLSL